LDEDKYSYESDPDFIPAEIKPHCGLNRWRPAPDISEKIFQQEGRETEAILTHHQGRRLWWLALSANTVILALGDWLARLRNRRRKNALLWLAN
jgi:hypothetical protein